MSQVKVTLLTPWFTSLLLIVFMAGCYDTPVSVDGESVEFPSEKLSIIEDAELGIDEGQELGLVTDRSTDRGGNDQDQATRSNPVGRANAVAREYLRILHSLSLTDDQWVRVRHCFAEYKECVESASMRFKAAHREIDAEFRAKIERIKNAVANGDMTPERARALYQECAAEYRASIARLNAAYHEAIANCLQSLRRCIASVLNDRQLARWNELTSDRGNDGGDRVDENGRDNQGDRGDRDNQGDRDDNRGERGDENGRDNQGDRGDRDNQGDRDDNRGDRGDDRRDRDTDGDRGLRIGLRR